MKLFHSVFTVLIAATFWIPTSASALPILDTVDPTETFLSFGSTPSPCPSGFACTANNLSFTHNIVDNGFLAGLQTITSATIAVHLSDEGGPENYSILIGDALQTVTVANLGSNVVETIALNAAALADLAADGNDQRRGKVKRWHFLFCRFSSHRTSRRYHEQRARTFEPSSSDWPHGTECWSAITQALLSKSLGIEFPGADL